jgi:hypothetical protein
MPAPTREGGASVAREALALVTRVKRLGERFRRRKARGEPLVRGEEVAVQLVRATQEVARNVRRLPLPPPTFAERTMLTLASSQLKALGAVVAESPRVLDSRSVDRALLDLIGETVDLVEWALDDRTPLGEGESETRRRPALERFRTADPNRGGSGPHASNASSATPRPTAPAEEDLRIEVKELNAPNEGTAGRNVTTNE